MTTATETKKPAIKEEVTSLADRIKASLELDTASGLVAEKEGVSVYTDAATEAGLTQEAIGAVKKFETTVCAATTLAVGQIGVEAMKKHSDLGTVQGTIKMYGDETFTAGIHRETTSRNPKTGEASQVHGQTFTSFAVTSSANKGQMAKVRSSLKEMAAEALGKGK